MFETIRSKTLYTGPSYSFSVDTIMLPNGKPYDLEQLHHPGGVVVLALDGNGRIPMVRQYRYGVKQELLELPAGKLDKTPGETPEKGALRELKEETGCEGEHIKLLGIAYPSPGVVTEVLHIYMASIKGQTNQELDAEEFIKVEWYEKDTLRKMVADNTIKDAKTICAFSMAMLKGWL